MHYAINLGDLTVQIERHPVLAMVIGDAIDRSGQTIQTDCKRFDGTAVQMTCDEERAEAIIRVARMKLNRNELRVYQSKTGRGGWKRI